MIDKNTRKLAIGLVKKGRNILQDYVQVPAPFCFHLSQLTNFISMIDDIKNKYSYVLVNSLEKINAFIRDCTVLLCRFDTMLAKRVLEDIELEGILMRVKTEGVTDKETSAVTHTVFAIFEKLNKYSEIQEWLIEADLKINEIVNYVKNNLFFGESEKEIRMMLGKVLVCPAWYSNQKLDDMLKLFIKRLEGFDEKDWSF
jgi:hypothetical protein